MYEEAELGNTNRYEAKFGEDWTTNRNAPIVRPIDPPLIKFKVYDTSYNLLNEYNLGPSNRIELGSYFFDWVPTNLGDHILEWYIEADGTPSLRRFLTKVVFMKKNNG